jgi:hypothetical protein
MTRKAFSGKGRRQEGRMCSVIVIFTLTLFPSPPWRQGQDSDFVGEIVSSLSVT